MRVVLDTNVLIAAFITRGVCAELLEHCALRHTLVTSPVILAEFHEHLVGKFEFTRAEAEEATRLIESLAELVVPTAPAEAICRDGDDDLVIGTAVVGNAECIITGDKDLLAVECFQGIAILSPKDFASFESLSD